jgi:hypothetical protein
MLILYTYDRFIFCCRLQFEVISSSDDVKGLLTQQLTNCYDEYLEDWVGDYWVQPKHLPAGFVVSSLVYM